MVTAKQKKIAALKQKNKKVERPDYLPDGWQGQITKFRAAHKLTQQQLATKMGIHWYSIYRWECNPAKSFPTRLAWERFQVVKSENKKGAK